MVISSAFAAPLNVVSPYLVHAVAPVHHVAVAAPVFHTQVHYAETPVVVGHSAQILKPALAAPLAVPHPLAAPLTVVQTIKKEEEEKPVAEKAEEKPVEVKTVPLAFAPAPLAFAAPAPLVVAPPAVLDLKAPAPSGDAPPMSELVQKQKVLAPVRTTSEVIPQVTVQHPTKVNVEKVAVQIPVATPYAHPVPVAVAPHYEIHQFHAPALTVVA